MAEIRSDSGIVAEYVQPIDDARERIIGGMVPIAEDTVTTLVVNEKSSELNQLAEQTISVFSTRLRDDCESIRAIAEELEKQDRILAGNIQKR